MNYKCAQCGQWQNDDDDEAIEYKCIHCGHSTFGEYKMNEKPPCFGLNYDIASMRCLSCDVSVDCADSVNADTYEKPHCKTCINKGAYNSTLPCHDCSIVNAMSDTNNWKPIGYDVNPMRVHKDTVFVDCLCTKLVIFEQRAGKRVMNDKLDYYTDWTSNVINAHLIRVTKYMCVECKKIIKAPTDAED